MEHIEQARDGGPAVSTTSPTVGASHARPDAGDVDASGSTFVMTGDQAVDGALGVLETLQERSVREHVAAFEAVHGALSDRLAETRE